MSLYRIQGFSNNLYYLQSKDIMKTTSARQFRCIETVIAIFFIFTYFITQVIQIYFLGSWSYPCASRTLFLATISILFLICRCLASTNLFCFNSLLTFYRFFCNLQYAFRMQIVSRVWLTDLYQNDVGFLYKKTNLDFRLSSRSFQPFFQNASIDKDVH